jgi:Raf kinase inhibitor-like YbhB/YbcL family protein
MTLKVTSSAFEQGAAIPLKYTCDGENLSPQVGWSEAPAGTQSFALIMDDPDAPMGTYVHWVLYDLPTGSLELPEAVQSAGVAGVNSSRKSGYTGPCPPRGSPHHYNFKVYALDQMLGLQAGSNKADLEKAMQGHVLAWGQLTGVFGR